jgi:hypothetical protein
MRPNVRRPAKRDLIQLGPEVLLIGLALPFYYLVRGFTEERVDEAFERAEWIIRLEKRLGIFWEIDLQALILPASWLVYTLNSLYLYGHLPVILAVAVWLYVRHRREYLLMRNAFLISGAIGLAIYATYPLAPPRFMDEYGFVDTVFDQYGVSRVANPDFLRNEYAAMPSLHFGWNLLAGVAMWMASRGLAVRAIALTIPPLTLAAVVLTANHYILDVVAGAATVGVGLAVAIALYHLMLRHKRSLGERPTGWLCWLGGVASAPVGLPLSPRSTVPSA